MLIVILSNCQMKRLIVGLIEFWDHLTVHRGEKVTCKKSITYHVSSEYRVDFSFWKRQNRFSLQTRGENAKSSEKVLFRSRTDD